MRKLVRWLLVVSLMSSSVDAAFIRDMLGNISEVSSTGNKFKCEAKSFVSFNTNPSPRDGTSNYNTISLKDGSILSEDSISGVNGVNSIGYNVKDNYIWGWNLNAQKVVRITADRKSQLYDIQGLSKRFYVAADVDQNGILYLFSRNGEYEKTHISRVDLNSLQKLPEITLNRSINTADIAFHPTNGKLYFVESGTDMLHTITLNGTNGTVDNGKSMQVPRMGEVIINYFDKDGNFYFNFGVNSIYKFNVNSSVRASWFSDLAKDLRNGDGARCANAKVQEVQEFQEAELIADYHFDECAWNGTEKEVKDSSGHGFDGKAINSANTDTTDGQINGSGKFTRKADGVIVEDITGLDSNDFSVSFWTKIDSSKDSKHELLKLGNVNADNSVNGNNGILAIHYAENVGESKTGELIVMGKLLKGKLVKGQHSKGSSYTQMVKSNLKDGKWHHIVVTYVGENMKIYIDTADKDIIHTNKAGQSGVSKLGILDEFNGVLEIGNNLDNKWGTNANIDEVKLYNSALSSAQISQIYNNEKVHKNYDGSTREDISCPTPFSCDSSTYLFTSLQDASYTKALKVGLLKGDVTTAKDNFGDAHINAIGFNPVDGFIYGWDYGEGANYSNNYDPHIVRVDSDYNITRVDIDGELPMHRFYIGDVSKDGIYYLAYREGGSYSDPGDLKTIYRVDLNSKKVLSTLTVKKGTYINQIVTADFAINPIDSQIYLVNAVDAHLLMIDKDSGEVSDLGYIGIEPIKNNIYTTYSVYSFFDKYGNYYFQVNQSSAYKIDISKPWSSPNSLNAQARFFNNITIDNSGDGARCALAGIGDMAILTIDQKLIKVPEGDANVADGTNGVELNITIRSDRTLEKDVSVIVGQDPNFGDAKRGVDYIEQISSQITLPKGMSSKTFVTTVVKADSKIEKNEMFRYIFSVDPDNKNDAIFVGELPTVDIKIIDDDFASFTAFDIDESNPDLTKRPIKTKLVGEQFTLRFSSLNPTGIDDFDRNTTTYKIVDSIECQKSSSKTDVTGFSLFEIPDGKFSIEQNITINKAAKDLRVEFIWKDSRTEHWHKSCSKDNFAVRPVEFSFGDSVSSLSMIATAGTPYRLPIYALNGENNSSISYAEQNGVSFKIDVNQTQPNKCHYDASKFDDSNMTAFVDGILDGTIMYGNVGELNIKVLEINGSEFALVDKDDTTDEDRFIKKVSTNIKFVPDHFKMGVKFDNKHTDKGYAFYSNQLSSSPIWTINAQAVDENDHILSNFDAQCIGGGVDLNITLDINCSDNLELKTNVIDGSEAIGAGGAIVVLDTNISNFNDGEGSSEIQINFLRDNTPKDPVKVVLKTIEVKDGNVTGLKDLNVSEIGNYSTQYQYMRAYIQSPISVIGSYDLETEVYYETYQSLHNVVNAIKDGISKSGEYNWYRSQYDNKAGKMSFKRPYPNKYAKYPRVTVTNEDNKTVSVTAKELPERNVITLKVDDDFAYSVDNNLLYSTNKIKTNVSFIPDTVNWAGDGDTGMIVDTNISKHSVFKKMNW